MISEGLASSRLSLNSVSECYSLNVGYSNNLDEYDCISVGHSNDLGEYDNIRVVLTDFLSG